MKSVDGAVTGVSGSIRMLPLVLLVAMVTPPAVADEADDADLAQELTNPLADLMTIPIQMNVDHGIGPTDDGSKVTTNVQPVVPFDVGEDWNLITRTIMPVVYQDDVVPGEGSQFGLGDVNATLFFSPKQPTESGLTWGVGPERLRRAGSPRVVINSSLTILITCWAGVRLFITSAPTHRSRTRLMKSLTTLKLTSASSRASRTSRRAASTSASVSRPRLDSWLNTPCSLSDRFSNTFTLSPGLSHVSSLYSMSEGQFRQTREDKRLGASCSSSRTAPDH